MQRGDRETAVEFPMEQLHGSLEALLDESKVNAEQVSTAGEKKYCLSMSLGRGVRIMPWI
jgi:hypothetical protein